MKNNAEYLSSVMKKYGEARAKRRRKVNIIASAVACFALLVMASSAAVLRHGGLAMDLVVSDAEGGTNGVTSHGPTSGAEHVASTPALDEPPQLEEAEPSEYMEENIASVDSPVSDTPSESEQSEESASSALVTSTVSSELSENLNADYVSSFSETPSAPKNNSGISLLIPVIIVAVVVFLAAASLLIANNIHPSGKKD